MRRAMRALVVTGAAGQVCKVSVPARRSRPPPRADAPRSRRAGADALAGVPGAARRRLDRDRRHRGGHGRYGVSRCPRTGGCKRFLCRHEPGIGEAAAHRAEDGYTAVGYAHWCPACECMHAFAVDRPFKNGARWTFDGNVNAPTFLPSMNISVGPYENSDVNTPLERCHYA